MCIKYLTECHILCVHAFYHVLLACNFIVSFSGKGWQLTCMQHTRRLTHMQYTKYDLYASYYRAAHKV